MPNRNSQFFLLSQSLVGDGWLSPNCYSNHFDDPENEPGVYLIVAADNQTFKKGAVAYVGMSHKLAQRLAGHPVKTLVEKSGLWPMVWFKRFPKHALRKVEREYIQKFDPPLNVMGKKPKAIAL